MYLHMRYLRFLREIFQLSYTFSQIPVCQSKQIIRIGIIVLYDICQPLCKFLVVYLCGHIQSDKYFRFAIAKSY